MLSRQEIKDYTLQICIPMMERTMRRAKRGEMAFKPDQKGFVPSLLENFCRPFWGIAPLIAQGENIVLRVDGNELSVYAYVREMLLKGFSHGKEESWDKDKAYFDEFAYENQNITELAGLAIGIFLAKDILWEPFSREEKDMIAEELYMMAEVAFEHSWPNNHYWFPLLTFTVLKRLGYVFERMDEMLDDGLDLLDRLYLGQGWHKDGEFGRFDYYEAWSLHMYPLLWTLIADESFHKYQERRQAYIERTNLFLPFYTHWFDEKGAHVAFGRSLSYRFAACSLFPVAVLAGCKIEPALAGRLTAMNIGFFKKHYKGEETDILSEGYLYRSTNVIEGYTSDGGAYWCCKAFLALLLPENHEFWNYEKARIPAEIGDYLVVPDNKDIHILFEGHDGIVTMYNNTAQYYLNGQMTHKFGDMRAWYGKFVYNSAAGFACSACDNVSFDNMISLMTPDKSMVSHRLGYTDLGYEKGKLHSLHLPFANDPQTTIESWVIPMGGVHVRVHKVKLAQPYYVQEGGFALSRWDDYCPKEIEGNIMKISTREFVSVMKAASTVKINMFGASPQANFHLYAPLAAYPCYITELLMPGEYLFAAAFALMKRGCAEAQLPEVEKYIYGEIK